jgi:signal transduction histidine kinase
MRVNTEELWRVVESVEDPKVLRYLFKRLIQRYDFLVDEHEKVISLTDRIHEIEVAKINELLETTRSVSAGISHELRTPLQAIKSSLEASNELIDQCKVDVGIAPCNRRDVKDNIHDAMEVLDYGISVLDTLSHYAKSGTAVNIQRVNVVELINNTYNVLKLTEPFKSLLSEQFVFKCAEEVCLVDINSVELTQIIRNLCKNAIESLEPHKKPPQVTLEVFTVDKTVYIRVSDNGRGIDVDEQNRIFLPYFSTKVKSGNGNQGLGLSIVKNIVESYGGEINFTSGPAGTTFVVSLPCYDSEEVS